jgi:hypothetical protein
MKIFSMLCRCILFFSFLFFSSSILPHYVHAQPSGEELAQTVYDRDIGEDSLSNQVMELVPAHGQKRVRELTISSSDRGNVRKTLIRFTSPADIQGTGFLAIEDHKGETEQFLYLPALKRTRRIVADQKARSFVNSDFTYEDMQRQPVEESAHSIVGEEDLNGVQCWILESRPKPEAESQYSMRKSWVAKEMHLALRVDFFSGSTDPIKRYTVLQLENIQEIWTETKLSMEDLGSGHKTILENKKITYDTGIPDSVFTQQALENW